MKPTADNAVLVLIAADAHRNRIALPSAYELARYRLGRKQWGLRSRTRYRASIREGQTVLFYISGHREFAQHFVARAVIGSIPKPVAGERLLDAPNFESSLGSEYKVDLKSIRWFKRPVCARDLVSAFSFIAPARRKIWRIYFQGGALRIPERDAELIVMRSR